MDALHRFVALIRQPWVPWVIAIVCLIFAAYAVQTSNRASHDVQVQADTNTKLIKRLNNETNERRDIGCFGAENAHLKEINDLKDAYSVIAGPNRPKIYNQLLKNPIILADFKETVLAAANDEDALGEFVSPFCDAPGYGRPEPDPSVPVPPARVQRLLPGIKKQIVKQQTVTLEDELKHAQSK